MSVRMTTAEIVQATGGRFVSGTALSMIEAVCTDSRKARPGSLFVAMPGAHCDGHAFIEDAFSRGAIGACIESASGCRARIQKKYPQKMLIEVADSPVALGEISRFWRQKLRLPVVAVIGPNSGTVARIAGHIAHKPRGAHTIAAPPGERLGLEYRLLELNARHGIAIVALGSAEEAACARRLVVSDPDIIALTGTDTAGARSACPLPRDLGARHTLVVSADDRPIARRARAAGARVITFGAKKGDVRISGAASPAGRRTACTLTINRTAIPLPHLAQSASADILPAAAVAHALGLSPEDILAGVQTG